MKSKFDPEECLYKNLTLRDFSDVNKNYTKESETPLKTRFKDFLKGAYGKIRRNLGKIGLGIYEGVLAKYLYDLHGVLSDPVVRITLGRGKLPVAPIKAYLFPWPTLYNPLEGWPRPPIWNPSIIFSRPMTEIEHYVLYFGDHPELQIVAITIPLLAYGVYYGIKNMVRGNDK